MRNEFQREIRTNVASGQSLSARNTDSRCQLATSTVAVSSQHRHHALSTYRVTTAIRKQRLTSNATCTRREVPKIVRH